MRVIDHLDRVGVFVFYHVIMHIWSFVLDLASISLLTTEEKDIEILPVDMVMKVKPMIPHQ